MDAWVIWLIAAVIFGSRGDRHPGFFLAPFAGGAPWPRRWPALGAGATVELGRRSSSSRSSCSPRCGRSPARTSASRRGCGPARRRSSGSTGDGRRADRQRRGRRLRAARRRDLDRARRTTTTRSSSRATRVHVLEIRGATALVARMRRPQWTAGLIALIVLAVFVFIVAAVGRADRAAGARGDRRAARPLLAHARPGADADRPVHRPRQAADRPARAGRLVPAAAGDHRGQPRGRDRHRHLLHGHRPARPPPTRSPTRCRRSSSSPSPRCAT